MTNVFLLKWIYSSSYFIHFEVNISKVSFTGENVGVSACHVCVEVSNLLYREKVFGPVADGSPGSSVRGQKTPS